MRKTLGAAAALALLVVLLTPLAGHAQDGRVTLEAVSATPHAIVKAAPARHASVMGW